MQHTYRNEAERRTWQNPEAILAQAGVKAGDVVIDLACGFGFFAIPAAKMVGSGGVICGVDVDKEALDELSEKAAMPPYRHRFTSVRGASSPCRYPTSHTLEALAVAIKSILASASELLL